MTNTIQLSDQSINELTELCRIVLRKNPNNEISVNMAKGISEYMTNNRVVTEKQAHWLARNLDFYRITRPAELIDIVVGNKPTGAAASVPASLPSTPQDSFQSQIVSSLNRIEKLLSVFAAK